MAGNSPVKDYTELAAWIEGMNLVELIYSVTRSWPREEIYGLTGQIRRAAVSVPANIAEGQGRTGTGDFLRHLSIARGSLREVETHIRIANRLDYVDDATARQVLAAAAQVSRPLNGLIRSLEDR